MAGAGAGAGGSGGRLLSARQLGLLLGSVALRTEKNNEDVSRLHVLRDEIEPLYFSALEALVDERPGRPPLDVLADVMSAVAPMLVPMGADLVDPAYYARLPFAGPITRALAAVMQADEPLPPEGVEPILDIVALASNLSPYVV